MAGAFADFKVVGKVVGFEQKTKRDGTVIPGFFSVNVQKTSDGRKQYMGVNAQDKNGQPNPFFPTIQMSLGMDKQLVFSGYTKTDTDTFGKERTYWNITGVTEHDGSAIEEMGPGMAAAQSSQTPQSTQAAPATPAPLPVATAAGIYNQLLDRKGVSKDYIIEAEWALGRLIDSMKPGEFVKEGLPDNTHSRCIELVIAAHMVAENLARDDKTELDRLNAPAPEPEASEVSEPSDEDDQAA